MELKEFYIKNYETITWVIGVIGIGLCIFFKSYLNEKGKLKALKSENTKLINQTEEIKAKYSRELEELKKDHQLDITKRKHQYESKKETYIKFFKMLDEMSGKNTIVGAEQFLPCFTDFMRNYLDADSKNSKKGINNAITVFSQRLQKMLFEANQDLIKFKQETNTIRLLASDDVIEKLNLLDFSLERINEKSNKVMKQLPNNLINNKAEVIQQDYKEIEIDAFVSDKIKSDLIQLMRKELNEI